MSVGAAALPDDAITTRELVRTADRALYLAKEAGRNRVQMGADDGVAAALHTAGAAGPIPALPGLEAGPDRRP